LIVISPGDPSSTSVTSGSVTVIPLAIWVSCPNESCSRLGNVVSYED
jgi:hypothetical protein